jgi:hypothetical protein
MTLGASVETRRGPRLLPGGHAGGWMTGNVRSLDACHEDAMQSSRRKRKGITAPWRTGPAPVSPPCDAHHRVGGRRPWMPPIGHGADALELTPPEWLAAATGVARNEKSRCLAAPGRGRHGWGITACRSGATGPEAGPCRGGVHAAPRSIEVHRTAASLPRSPVASRCRRFVRQRRCVVAVEPAGIRRSSPSGFLVLSASGRRAARAGLRRWRASSDTARPPMPAP